MSAAELPVIDARGLQVRAGEQVLLHDVNLRITAGERVAIVGHNGAGKSTLLRSFSAFARVDGGQLIVQGADLTRIGEARAHRDSRAARQLRSGIAQVLQGLHLVGRLSALDNVLIGGAARSPSWVTWLRRWPARERAKAKAALARVGMAWAAGRRTDSLSGGERQKVAIARALHQETPVIFADEPTASLDAESADEVIELLRDVVAERSATLVCVVHDLDLLPRLADRVIALRRGRVVTDARIGPDTAAQLRSILR